MKKSAIRIAVAVLLLFIVVYFMYFDYCGVYKGMSVYSDFVKQFPDDALYHRGCSLGLVNGCVFPNNIGRAVVAQFDGNIGNNKIAKLRCYADKVPTHFSFLWVKEGMDLFELVDTVGAPDYRTGVGVLMVHYQLYDGMEYHITLNDGCVENVSLWQKDGTEVDLNSYQKDVRIVYMVISVLVCVTVTVLLILKKKGILFGKKNAESQ